MERLERRAIGRVSFPSQAVIVICDTEEVLHARVRDIGPIGVGAILDPGTKSILNKDVIIVAETLIMYADVVREQPLEDGSTIVGLAARKFPQNVLQFIFESIENNAENVPGADEE